MLPDEVSFQCPADKSLLNAAHAAGVLISYSCRSGQCGSCRGRIVSGKVVYADGLPDAISDSEASDGQVLFCSAYPASDLTIQTLKPDPG